MKLKSVEIENYKSYALNEKVEFSNLNVITGVNSAGKSSLIESLLILGQSDSHDILNGYLKKLGSVDNLKNNQLSKEESKTITFKYSFDDSTTLNQMITIEDGKRPSTYPKIIDMAYLSAERIGVLDSYKKSRDLDLINPKGEGLISLLYEKSISKEVVIKNRNLFFNDKKIREIFPKLPVYESNPMQQSILEHKGIDYKLNPGDGAFYGPKIDFKMKDSIGRIWQCGTIQLDYNLPQRFEMSYIGADGEKHEPVMIHRAMYGSLERFLGILIEHYAGAFPIWLAPVQARILTISDEQVPFAKEVFKKLQEAGIRVEIDTRVEKIGYKIREANGDQKIPVQLIIGKNEVANNEVNVRRFGSQDSQNVSVDEIVNILIEESKVPFAK